MRNLLLLTVGALLLASCNGGGTVTPPTAEQPPLENPPIVTPPVETPPTTTPDKATYIPTAGAAVGSGDGTKEGTIYVSPTAEEIDLLNLINEVRTKGTAGGVDVTAGSCVSGNFIPLKSITFNGLYSYAARMHADYTTNVGFEGHYENQTSSSFFYGRTVADRVVRTYKEKGGIGKYYSGENVVNYGGELVGPERKTALDAIQSAMRSTGHCKALMDADLYDMGVGKSYRESSSSQDPRPQTAWVMIVGMK